MANKKNEKINEKVSLSFAAIDKVLVNNIVENEEVEVKGKDFISWGKNNDYPNYLADLYNSSTTLRSVINQVADFISGNKVTTDYPVFSTQCNSKGETIEDVVHQIALSLLIYGGFVVNVTKNRYNQIAALNVLDFKNIRSNKDNTEFYYSDSWGIKYGRAQANKYPRYTNDGNQANSILYYKNSYYTTYPNPVYGAATIAAEAEKAVGEYHLNAITNGFAGGIILSLNNGVPSDEQKAEIEENFVEKFCSYKNAGRAMIVYSNSGDNAPTLSEVKTDDFSEKYKALMDNSRQQIYTSFGVHPVLLGNVVNNGTFNSEDFNEAWKLYSRTRVRSWQRVIVTTLAKLGVKITIMPFTIDWTDEEE